MEIETVLPTSPIKPITIQGNGRQKKQQQHPHQNPADIEPEQKDKFEQENNDGVQHIDEIV